MCAKEKRGQAITSATGQNTMQNTVTAVAAQPRWLSLKEASDFLGVHFTTLRTWSDSGDISVFRTPGGHRRFSLADLRRFLEERAGHALVKDETALVEAAVVLVRHEIDNTPTEQLHWHYNLDEHASYARQRRGRQLFALAISFVLKPAHRTQILEDGRKLGWEYGQEASASGVSLVAAGRAVRFFRSQLLQSLRKEENPDHLDADDLRIQKLIDQFLDEVLFSVLDGYEQNLTKPSGRILDSGALDNG